MIKFDEKWVNCINSITNLFETTIRLKIARSWIENTPVSSVTVESSAICFELRVVFCESHVTIIKCEPLQSNTCHCGLCSNGMQRYCDDPLVSSSVRPSVVTKFRRGFNPRTSRPPSNDELFGCVVHTN